MISDRISDLAPMESKELKTFMNFHGISRREMSEILGVSENAVRYWLEESRPVNIIVTRLIRLFQKYPKLIKEF